MHQIFRENSKPSKQLLSQSGNSDSEWLPASGCCTICSSSNANSAKNHSDTSIGKSCVINLVKICAVIACFFIYNQLVAYQIDTVSIGFVI